MLGLIRVPGHARDGSRALRFALPSGHGGVLCAVARGKNGDGMRLYKRGDVYWWSVTEAGRTVRRSTRERDREAARLVVAEWERQRSAANPTPHNATVRNALERFLKVLPHDVPNENTRNMYECKARHVDRLLGAVRLRDIELDGVARVRGFIEQRESEGASSHTIHRELTTLRRALRVARESRLFQGDPRAVIPRYAAGYVPRTRYLSCFELAAVMDHLDPGRAAMLAFVVATSSRRSEVRRAQRGDVGREHIALRGSKTLGSKRLVPVVSLFRGLVDRAVRDGDGRTPLLFRPWGNMRRDIAATCRRVGCDPFTWNDLRRTTGTWLLQLGVSIDVVAKVMGHASTAMLYRVYGQLNAGDLGRLIESRLL